MQINLSALEANNYSKNNIARCFDNTTQEIIILPTEKCNFRCSYCYEDFTIGKMKPWLIKSINKFIANRVKNIKHLSLSWFGGEPLLAKKICLEIIEKAYNNCKLNDVSISGSFTTNGYLLTNELVEKLAEFHHANFQITLDGSMDEHNKTRVLANGKETFKKIWSNIINLKNSDINFNITLRLHISHQNYFSMKRLVQSISKTMGKDKRFDVHFHKITNLGGPNTTNLTILDGKKYSDIVDEFQNILNINYNSELSLHKDRNICYAAKPNSILVRADGRIGKCTVAFDNPQNTIGNFNTDGTININNNKLQPWLKGFDSANPHTLSCPVTALNDNNDIKVKII